MFTLCFVSFFLFLFLCFCLWFKLHFLIHLASLMHHLLPLFISYFLSLLPLDSFVYSWQKGGKYTKEYTKVYHHFYMTHVHILRGRNSTSCTFVGGESHKGNAYTKGEKTSFLRQPYFILFYLMLIFSLFMVLWVMFSIYALLLSSHHVYVLDMHISLLVCFIDCMFGWLFALLYDHYGHFHSIVLYLIKLLICFTLCLLDRILLVTLYLSF